MYRKNVAGQNLGFALVNASTGAALTGATVTVKKMVDGAAQASATGTVSEGGSGQYNFALSQADTNGNQISLLFTATSAIPVEKTIVTTAADPTNATTFGITDIDAAISSRSTYAGGDTSGTTTLLTRIPGTVQPQTGDSFARLGAPAGASVSADVSAVGSITTAIKAKTDNLPASPAATGAQMDLVNAPNATALNAAADALLDRAAGIESGWTLRQGCRMFLASLAGLLSGAATTTVTITNPANTKNRITATVDANGNRSAITYDAS